MFHYKSFNWLLDNSCITRRRLVNGVLQESLLDQVLFSNMDMSRDFMTVSPLGKSDHICILFEIKCSNNTESISKVKKNWGKFRKSDIEELGENKLGL